MLLNAAIVQHAAQDAVILILQLKSGMKLKSGYRHDKPIFSTGKWLKRYFEKRTVRRRKKIDIPNLETVKSCQEK